MLIRCIFAPFVVASVLNGIAPSGGVHAEAPRASPSPAPGTPSLDLAGTWLLTMPKGFEYEARWERVDGKLEYRLVCGATMLRGGYEFCGRRLRMTRAEDERLAGLVWEVKNKNVLLLIEHPEESQFGSDYRNATLSRQKSAGERESL